MIADWTWVQLLTTVSGLYTLAIAVFLIRDNRSPQSTFAWLFLMLVFPIGGVIIYTLFGRGWKAFSRKNQLHSLMEGTSLADRRTALLERQPGILEALSNDGTGEYGRLGRMLWASAGAPITLANQFQILQNASEMYPQLLNDMRAASKSIHLLFYEWAEDAFTETVRQVLAERVAAGVDVRILYDPVGSLTMLSWRYVRRMRLAGVQMYPYSPLYLLHTISLSQSSKNRRYRWTDWLLRRAEHDREASIPGRVLSRQDRVCRFEHLLHRVREHGCSELLDQL